MRALFSCLAILLTGFLSGCNGDDPTPVNEEEVITTVQVTLVSQDGGPPVLLRFFDRDGELGANPPEITVSGSLEASSTYSAVIDLQNETEDPPIAIAEEVEEESEHHLFCFDVGGNIVIEYADHDLNGLPIGLLTTWEIGGAGPAEVTVTLRHQPGTKTGECPGGGDTDAQVTFPLVIQ